MRRLLLSKALAVALSRSKPCMSCGCSLVAFSMSVRRVCNTNSTQVKQLEAASLHRAAVGSSCAKVTGSTSP